VRTVYRSVLTLGTVLCASFGGVAEALALPEGVVYRHAYYLFLVSPSRSCEDCYIPLLLTPEPLESVVRDGRPVSCVVVTICERDSIVGAPRRGVPVAAADVQPRERHLRMGDREYRYHDVRAEEVLRLLQSPQGGIPIHRTLEMGAPRPEELRDLLAGFRAVP
jgi:hypothetical protein